LKAELQLYLLETALVDNQTTDDDVKRFVAMMLASECADMNRREMIDLFVDGVPPMTKKRVVGWLKNCEECAENDDDARPPWPLLFKEFYGPKSR